MSPVAVVAQVHHAVATEKLDGTCCYVSVYKGETSLRRTRATHSSHCRGLNFQYAKIYPIKIHYFTQDTCIFFRFVFVLYIYINKTNIQLILDKRYGLYLIHFQTDRMFLFFSCRATSPVGSTRQETQQTSRQEVQKASAFSS